MVAQIGSWKSWNNLGHFDAQVVNVLTFYSNDPSENPVKVYDISAQFLLARNRQKEAGGCTVNFLNFMLSQNYRNMLRGLWLYHNSLSLLKWSAAVKNGPTPASF